jgi:hypothetical protein
VIRPLYRRIHLTGLSQEAGPPLIDVNDRDGHDCFHFTLYNANAQIDNYPYAFE